MTYDEICGLLEPGIRAIYENDPEKMQRELSWMHLVALEYDMVIGKKPLPKGVRWPKWMTDGRTDDLPQLLHRRWWRLWMT
jgi:hypothetical protein